MRNVTLAMDEELIEKGRECARSRGMPFDALIRERLHELVDHPSDWTEEAFRAMEEAAGGSGGRRWPRDHLA